MHKRPKGLELSSPFFIDICHRIHTELPSLMEQLVAKSVFYYVLIRIFIYGIKAVKPDKNAINEILDITYFI